jgi:hypothetical protein
MNFSNFSSEEVRALYRYLHGMHEAGLR